MFRNPRENASRGPSEKVLPNVGRPPSPPTNSNGISCSTATQKMALETERPQSLPIGPAAPSKATPPKSEKTRPKANTSILSFFKKANPNEAANVQVSNLFVTHNGRSAPSSSAFQALCDDQGSAEPHLAESAREEGRGFGGEHRFNESPQPVKRRKVSRSSESSPAPIPAKEAFETFDKKGCTPPPDDFDDERNRANPEDREALGGECPPTAARAAPFLDESDSDEEARERHVQARSDHNEAEPCTKDGYKPVQRNHFTGVGGESELYENADGCDVHKSVEPGLPAPALKRERTSLEDADGFADFEGLEDFEDEYEEGEEFVERKYMQEQRRLEAEAGLIEDFDDEDSMEATKKPENNSVDPCVDTNGASEQAIASCPICAVSFEGISSEDVSIHTNNCLDGNPTPLPKTVESPAKQNVTLGSSKRFVRPPRPGQDNPFILGQPSSSSSAFSKLMSGHSEENAWSAAAASERESRGKPSYQRTCPFYKILPGFFICVDAFRYGAVAGCNAYFLSHFHSDHYIGLTSSWSHGKIYCSRITANLVRQQLRVDPKWVVDLEWEEKVEVPNTQGVYVTMIPANHCPGSSLYLFEKETAPSKAAPSNAKPRVQRVLHCGDFRACPAHIAHPRLAPEVVDNVTGKLKNQRIDVCYLDTTYLNPRYAFPSQEDVIEACADMCVSLSKEKVDTNDNYEVMKRERAGGAMTKFIRKDSQEMDDAQAADQPKETEERKEKKARGALLVVVGTYSIGKERICLGIARALNSLIYAPQSKQRICKALNDPELNKRLTLDPLAASVHMTPLFEIRAETLSEYLETYRGHFSRAVGFRPSGWNYRPPGWRSTEAPNVQQVLYSPGWKSTFSMKDLVPQRGSNSKAGVYGVPYSEHSSFRELSMFVCGLRIEKIIPTVNVGSAKSRERMRAWCERWQAEKRKNGLFRVKQPPDAEGKVSENENSDNHGEFYPGQGTWELRTTL